MSYLIVGGRRDGEAGGMKQPGLRPYLLTSDLMTKHASSLEDRRFADTRKRVVGWLRADGYAIEEIGENPSKAWAIAARGSDPTLIVFQDRKAPDRIGIQASLKLEERTLSALAGLAPAEYQDLLWDLRFRLLSLGVPNFGLEGPLDQIVALCTLYTDDLGRNLFEQTVERVRAGIFAFKWTVLRKLGAPLPTDEESFVKVN